MLVCGARSPSAREGLAEPDLDRLASPWHTDADLGRPIGEMPAVVVDSGRNTTDW
jgi:hypothetical protein